MVYDEGLRSYRAIIFIASKCKNRINRETIGYLELGASRQTTILTKQETLRGFSKNLGEKLWIK
ncbi:MAG TPA: hypothetical protein VF350_03925 [Candidatus Bathyarchaeia archaeon]